MEQETLQYYKDISPFQAHPCGHDCLFHPVAGFIDPDIFMMYYKPRENYLSCIQMIGHPYFICQFKRYKEELEDRVNYFTSLINEEQIKLRPLKKKQVLEKVICYLHQERYQLHTDQIIRYIYSLYSMYKDVKVLNAYPLSIDKEDILCRFE